MLNANKRGAMHNMINLTYDGADLSAWVFELPNKHHHLFKVCFSDGYENIFYTDVETGRWMEEDLGFTQLAEIVGVSMRPLIKLPVHVPKLLIWHCQYYNNKLLNFGFFGYTNGRYRLYEIYNTNKRYLYTLMDMENDEWQILGNSTTAINKIDPIFLDQIIKILPLYSEDYG